MNLEDRLLLLEKRLQELEQENTRLRREIEIVESSPRLKRELEREKERQQKAIPPELIEQLEKTIKDVVAKGVSNWAEFEGYMAIKVTGWAVKKPSGELVTGVVITPAPKSDLGGLIDAVRRGKAPRATAFRVAKDN